MTSDERKTLEALHDAPMTSIPAMDAIRSALAEIDALTQQVADLEARAIPKAWVARFPAYEINAWGSDDREKARVRVVGAASPVLTTWESDLPNDSVHPTLSDALAAAAKEPL